VHTQLRRAEAAAEEQRREAERLRQDKQMLEGELQAERSRWGWLPGLSTGCT
jgi:hypothetical protein